MTLEEAREIAMSLHACTTEGKGCKQCAYFKGEHSNCLNRLMIDASNVIVQMLGILDYPYERDQK